MTTSDYLPSGWFDQHRWWIDAGLSPADAVVLASAHEADHRQLQFSTAYGTLVLTLVGIARESQDPDCLRRTADLIRCAESVHEAFATWASLTSVGRSPDALNGYDDYHRHWKAMQRLVQDIVSPYARFHAAHAVARVCMQPPVAEVALDVGLDRFALSDLPESHRPDSRFRILRRVGIDWSPFTEALTDPGDAHALVGRLLDSERLTADLFDSANHPAWDLVNRLAYAHVAAELASRGCPSLDHDGHLAWGPPLLDAAAQILGHRLPLDAGGPRHPARATRDALRTYESEGFSNGPRLRARVLAENTDLAEMVAGTGEDAHAFLAILPTGAHTASYHIDLAADDQASPQDHAGARAVLRRTVIEDGVPTVECLDVTAREPEDLEGFDAVRTLVAMSVMSGVVARRWQRWTSPHDCVVLIDRSLASHLELWLSQPGSSFRYCLLKLESFGRLLPVLVGRLDVSGAGESHLMIKPLSDAGIRVHKAALEELAVEGFDVVADPTILDDGVTVLPLVLAHVAGEQTHFSNED